MKASQNCTTCSALIPDADLESGAAIALLGKRYCANCKGHAAKEVSLDDLMEGAPVPRPSDPAQKLAAAPVKSKAATPPVARTAPTAKPPPPGRPGSSGRNRQKAAVRRSSKGPLVAIGVIVAIAAVLGVVVMSLPSEDPKQLPTAGPKQPAQPATPETAGTKAQRDFVRVETLSRRSDVSLDAVLTEIEKIATECKGTSYEAKLEELRNNTIKQKESVEAQKALEGLVEKIRKQVEEDKDFRRYSILMESLRNARQTASKGAPLKMAELKKIQADYSSRYERAAEPFFTEIRDAARVLAFTERRYDDALAHINRFPVHLRHSGAWNGLVRLKKEIEDSKKRNRRR